MMIVRSGAASTLALAIAMAAGPGRAAEAAGPEVSSVTVTGERRVETPLLTQPVAQTPQAISVIPAEIIQLGGLNDVRDVLRLDPAVSAHADEDNAQGTNVQIRGFSARNDIYRDGQLDIGRYYRDPFDLQAVEVLTGPSSVLFGRGSTGGAMEAEAKRPLPEALQAATLSAGSDGLARVTADLNAPFASDAAARVNLMAHRSGVAGRDETYTQRVGVSPIATVGLTGPTQLTVGLLHQSQWDRPDYGVPWIDIGSPATNFSHPAAVPWNNYYGFKDDYSRVSADIATAELRQKLDSGWSLRDQLRYAFYTQGYRATDPVLNPVFAPGVSLAGLAVTRTMRGGHVHLSFLEDQADLTGTFEALSVKHTLVVGAEVGLQTADPTVLSFSGVPGTNLISPDHAAVFIGTPKIKSVTQFTGDTAAAFVGDTAEIGDWQLDGAVRVDRFAADFKTLAPTPGELSHVDELPSWRGAVVYRLTPAAHAYAMYGTSFDPSAENLSLSAGTAGLAPERNHTAEAGVKWSLAPSMLLSAAVFRTVKVNARETSPIDPTVSILAGTERAEGVELLAQGRITPNWLVSGGYLYLDTAVLSSPNNDAGQPLQNAPRNSLRLFTAYDLTPAWTVGGGLEANSSRVPASVPDANGFRQQVPGYWTASALVRYRVRPGVSLQLNADNLFDKRYYDGLDDNHVNVGAGRSVHLTLAVER